MIHLNHGLILGFTLQLGLRIGFMLWVGGIGVNGVEVGNSVGL